jgi:lipopolysaccharide export system protein LptA
MTAAHAARTSARVRTLRLAMIALGVALVVYLAWMILTRRPPSVASTPPAAVPPSPEGTLQTLERFQFTSTVSGKKDYAVSADRMRMLEGGLHTLEGIRSVEFPRPDGSTLKGSAERGSFKEAKSGDAVGGTLLLEGKVRLDGTEGERLESDRLEYTQAEETIVSPGLARFGFRNGTGEAGRLSYDMRARTAVIEGGITLRMPGEGGLPETRLTADRGTVREGGSSADLEGNVTVVRGADTLTGPSLHLERMGEGTKAMSFTIGSPARGRIDSATMSGASPGGPTTAASPAAARPLLIAAQRIEGTNAGAAGGEIVLIGSASITDETPVAGSVPRRIEADRIAMAEDRGKGRLVTAEGNVRATLPSSAPESGTHRAPPAAADGRPVGPRRLSSAILHARLTPAGKIESADAAGGVRFEGPEGTATAQTVRLLGEEKAELRGGRPALREAERTLTADEIDLDSSGERIDARGKVRSRFVTAGADSKALFAPGQPIEISSESAILKKAERTGEYTGQCWPGRETRARSDRLYVDDATEGHRRGARSAGPSGSRTPATATCGRDQSGPQAGPAGAEGGTNGAKTERPQRRAEGRNRGEGRFIGGFFGAGPDGGSGRGGAEERHESLRRPRPRAGPGGGREAHVRRSHRRRSIRRRGPLHRARPDALGAANRPERRRPRWAADRDRRRGRRDRRRRGAARDVRRRALPVGRPHGDPARNRPAGDDRGDRHGPHVARPFVDMGSCRR